MLYQVPAAIWDGDGLSPKISGRGSFPGGELSHIVLENRI